MNARLDKLADALQMPPASNPIGAGRLAGAFIETYRDAQMPHDLQPLMFRAYEQELARVLGDLYTRVNNAARRRRLRQRRCARRCRPRTSRWRAATRSPIWSRRFVARASPILPLPRSSPNCGRNCISGASICPVGAQAQHAMPRRELRVEEVVSVASLLQPESPDVFVRALAGQPVNSPTRSANTSSMARVAWGTVPTTPV